MSKRVKGGRVGIAILARAPAAGAVKTRLIPRLGAEGAAALHARLVRHAIATAVAAKLGKVTLWCTPNRHDRFFATCAAGYGIALRTQPPGDLGERMLAAFWNRSPQLLIGADCPALTPEHLREAAAALEDEDAVFLPAEDGGYVLVGLRRPVYELFTGMEWGVDTVMAETRQRLSALGLTSSEPAVLWDVDRPEDYERLVREGLDVCLRDAPLKESRRP